MLHLNQASRAINESPEPCTSSNAVAYDIDLSAVLPAACEINSLVASTRLRSRSQVLLATAKVTVSVKSDRAVTVRALLDQGSEVTFIIENLAQLLRTKRIRMPVSMSAVDGCHAGISKHATDIQLFPRNARSPAFTTTALILSKLTSYAPKRLADLSCLSHLDDLSWADSDPTSADPIGLILGADLYSEVLLEGIRKGSPGQPFAQNTAFGWVISGPIRPSTRQSTFKSDSRSAHQISVHHCLASPSLDNAVRKFWELEEIPRRSILSIEDEKCERHFRSTHSRTTDGRYIVRLPFKHDPPIDIGRSRQRATTSLASLLRRLHKNSAQFAAYKEFLEEYERLEHMRAVPSSTMAVSQCVYIPHHPVFCENSVTTRLRVVFNASSITSNGSSLNDHLLSGLKLQTNLLAVILRWHQFRYVYTADIAKMYRQILLDPRDVDFQRILWQSGSHDSVTEYQLLTVTYGMTCAPFLSLRIIQQLEEDEGGNFALAAPLLRHNIFVDDLLFGGDDSATLGQARNQLVALLRREGFELRKWATNSPSLLTGIDQSDDGLACKTLSPDETIKILGIGWNTVLDQFQFAVSLENSVPHSKRSILSAIAKFFDPLSWVTPVTITAKIFVQRLWRDKLDWDAVIPASLLDSWTRFYSKLDNLNGLKIPRWTLFERESVHAELHGFSDASNVAYSAVVYLRLVSQSGQVTITLLASSSSWQNGLDLRIR